jgi:hypothetical protein
MTPEQVKEAQDLISAHNSLRYQLARNGDCPLGLYAIDADQKTSQPRLPAPIGRQVLLVSIALVEAQLRELGVEPKQGLDRTCFECDGTGKVPIS